MRVSVWVLAAFVCFYNREQFINDFSLRPLTDGFFKHVYGIDPTHPWRRMQPDGKLGAVLETQMFPFSME
jgi:hypothetical protein